MDKCSQMANLYLATLRALYLIHQHNHWLIKGTNFYANHLLFQRVYESALENVDTTAEKFIGVLGDGSVDYMLQSELIHKIMIKYKSETMVKQSIAIEKDFLKLSKEVYDCFESEGKLSLGLDDMIMAIASVREEAIYLLSRIE